MKIEIVRADNITRINTLYNFLNDKFKNHLEIVNDIEYFGKLIDGIIVYFPTGEAFQIFIDVNNNVNNNNCYIVLDENLNIICDSINIDKVVSTVIKEVKKKNCTIEEDDKNGHFINFD